MIGEDEEKLIRIHLGDVDLDIYSGLLKAYSRVMSGFVHKLSNLLVEH